MKILLVLLLLIQQPFSWSDKKLAISDFKSTVSKGLTASSATEIILIVKREDGKEYYDVKAVFHPDQSYFSPTCRNPGYVLQHEQIHFDISELFARQIKFAIKQYQGQPVTERYRNDVYQVYDSLILDWKIMQSNYDLETEYSANVDEQTRWRKFINGKNM